MLLALSQCSLHYAIVFCTSQGKTKYWWLNKYMHVYNIFLILTILATLQSKLLCNSCNDYSKSKDNTQQDKNDSINHYNDHIVI